MQVGLIVLAILAAAAAGAIALYIADRHRKEFLAVAASLGLTYSTADPFDLDGNLSFGLFDRGDRRGCKHVLWGSWEGLEVRAFQYWYEIRHTDGRGNSSTETHRFSCVVVPVPVRAPGTTIGPETLLSFLGNIVGFHDIQFESEEFNKTMKVKSEDPKFANYLIDARMMRWLLDTAGWNFELAGEGLLCYEKRVWARDVPPLLAAVKGFVDHIPRVAVETYGGKA